MKALCMALLLVLAQCPVRAYQAYSVTISCEVRAFLNAIEFHVDGKSYEEIKQEYSTWIAKKENQNRFLMKLSEQIEDQKVLESLKHALQQWTAILELEKRPVVVHGQLFLNIERFVLSRSSNRCQCRQEYSSPEEEIEALQEEIADLKNEARDLLIKSAVEAIAAGGSAAAEQFIPAAAGVYQASSDFVDGCGVVA
jgi:hypothetical protein